MVVTEDIGPTLAQNNIAAAGVPVNDISIVATKAGHTLLLARVIFSNVTANTMIAMWIKRNAGGLAASGIYMQLVGAATLMTLFGGASIPDAVIGDVFTIMVSSSDSTADIAAGQAALTTVTA